MDRDWQRRESATMGAEMTLQSIADAKDGEASPVRGRQSVAVRGGEASRFEEGEASPFEEAEASPFESPKRRRSKRRRSSGLSATVLFLGDSKNGVYRRR
nr:hypothetical protein CFP56_52119 [Quercus suber]